MTFLPRFLTACLAVLTIVVAVGLEPTTALAQAAPENGDAADGDDEASDPEQDARELFAQGARAFDEGRYAAALGFFEDAYRISERHLLLYNIGQAQDRLRRDQEALATFRRYLEIVENPPYRLQVESRIRNLEESVARQEREHAALAAAEAREAELAAERERLANREDGLTAAGPGDGTPVDDEDDGGVLSQWWFWTIIGVVVVGGVAVGVGAAASGGQEEPIAGDVGGVIRTLRF